MCKRVLLSVLFVVMSVALFAGGGPERDPEPTPQPTQPEPEPEPTPPDQDRSPSDQSESSRETSPAGSAAANNTIGTLVYFDGRVDLQREGVYMTGDSVDFGLEINNYDLVATHATSYAEVELSTPAAPGVSVSIEENTAFYFEIAEVGGTPQTDFSLLSGSISFRVAQITGNGRLNVRTDSAVLGVRGTDFKVDSAPDGSLLVSVTQGRVAVADAEGEELLVEPGRVAQKLADGTLEAIPVSLSDVETFRENWYSDRIEAFRGNALSAIRFYANLYQEQMERFVDAYDRMMGNREILNRWDSLYLDGRRPGTAQRLRDNREMGPALLAVRQTLVIFERVYYRLVQLQDLHDNEGLGRGSVSSGYSTTAFFRDFEEDARSLNTMMARVRHAYDLYAYVNPDSPLRDLFGDGDDGDFFTDPDNFFGGS